MNSTFIEIAEEIKKSAGSIDEAQADKVVDLIINAKRIFCAGCGRSGLMMRAVAMRLMHLGLTSYFVGEPTQPSIREGDLLIVGSSSGKTSSMVSIAQRSKGLNAKVALITATEKSPLQEAADAIVLIKAKEVESVQPGGNVFEQSLLVTVDGIVTKVKNKLGISAAVMNYNHTNLE